MENYIIKTKRVVWKPTTSSSSLVVTIPKSELFKEGDIVTLSITSKGKIIIEKSH